MTRRLRLTTDARADLRQITLYIGEQTRDREAGRAFVRKIATHVSRFATLSGTLGTARPELRPDLGSTPFQNCIIFFRYREDLVEIVNVLDAPRYPCALR